MAAGRRKGVSVRPRPADLCEAKPRVPAEFQSLRSPGLRKPRTARPSSIPVLPSVRRHLPDAKEAANRSQPLPI